MDVANAVVVGLTVHSIHGDHILVVAVLDELQIPKLPLYRFLGCQEVSDLEISHAVRLLELSDFLYLIDENYPIFPVSYK